MNAAKLIARGYIAIFTVAGVGIVYGVVKDFRKTSRRIRKAYAAYDQYDRETEEINHLAATSRPGSLEWQLLLRKLHDRALLDEKYRKILNKLEG